MTKQTVKEKNNENMDVPDGNRIDTCYVAIASSGVLMLMADAAPSAPPIMETVGMYHADYFC